jgi:hypothetical protein
MTTPGGSSSRSAEDIEREFLDIMDRNGEQYFPVDADVSDLMWAPAYLRLLDEPSLALGRIEPQECFRLLWMPSFEPMVMVRVDGGGLQRRFVAKSWDGWPIESMGLRLELNASRDLTLDESRSFSELVEQSRFWQLDTPSPVHGMDGCTWVLEGRSPTRHHVVVRWSPRRDGPDRTFRELGAFMLRLVGQECG